MITRRIIPCLDIKDGRTVKGINFVNLRDAGDPVELASRYTNEGADELVFLDISATNEKRKTLVDLVRRVGEAINIPYSVGGGISTLSQAYEILKHGAEKISINSAAVKRPELAEEIANEFGSQCLIVAVDAKKQVDTWIVHTHGGRVPTSLELFDWVKSMENAGAGEILFTSMDHDGTKNGFALNALKQMNEMVSIPVIASGGAGTKKHFKEVFLEADADAALAASIFHYNEIPIMELKDYLSNEGISIRI